MANNQYVNKVLFGDEVLIDLTQDTVTGGQLISGYTAHDASGAQITGIIPIRNVYNIINGLTWENSHYTVNIPSGSYANNTSLGIAEIQIPVPASDTNTIIISVPNGSITPDPGVETDWISLEFTVDSNGNSDIVDSIPIAETTSF